MAWVAVSEATTAHGKQQSITRITRTVTTVAMLTGGAAIAAPPAPNQLPTGGQVAAGIAAIGTNGNTMTVTQTSNRAAINWNTFDIGSQAQVNFVQPSSSAVALNRVNSGNPSQIYGQLSSNGQVYLINAAGVYFAPGAQVNVGGIVATTHQMSDAAFMAGSTTFDRNGSTGKVINEGTITTSLNGYIAMLAPEVRNSGLLLAQSGTVAMGAGERITLNFGLTSKLESITVTEAQLDTLVENRSAIKAPNGLVILSARAANQLAASVVNSGTIEAKGVSQQGGRILLEGTTVTNTGTLDVSSDTAQAGTIQINGKNVSISGNVVATSPTQGGAIKVSATQSLNVANANLNTGATNGTGGQIELSAHQINLVEANLNADGDTGGSIQVAATISQPNNPFHDPLNLPTLPATLAATGFTSITSRGRRGQGGNVTLTGDDISLQDTTTINVSGAFGGGNALIGGDWQGSHSVYQATTVYMGQNVIIDASATDNGNGGKVVLWSDIRNANGWTNVYGGIYAKGGVNGGDGGQIETSGHAVDTAGVKINAGTTFGLGGLWLLDPYNYTIGAGEASVIVTSLNTGTSVTIDTAYSPTGSPTGTTGDILGLVNFPGLVAGTPGDITLTSSIAKTAGGDATLTFKAHRMVSLQANISSTSGKLNLVLWSDYDHTLNGGVAIGSSSGAITINTNGGSLWAGGSSTANGSQTWYGLTVGNGPSVGAAGANANALDLNADINTSGGNVMIWAGRSYADATRYGIGLYGNHTIASGAGEINLTADQIYNWSGSGTLATLTTGRLTLAPAYGSWANGFNFNGSTSGTAFILNNIGGTGQPLAILGFSSLGGLSIGYNDYTTVTISSPINIAGPIQISSDYIHVNNSLTTSGIINLQAYRSITQGAGGVLTAGELWLLGGGNATLTAANNMVGRLTARNMGDIRFLNTSNLSIVSLPGTVGEPGITASGVVKLGVLSGDINVTKLITTSSTSSDAVVLDAGVNSAAGDASGGNILISGSGGVSVGSGGRATLYTGSISGSTGLVTLVGINPANYRYNSNASTTLSPALGVGLYGIYREALTPSPTPSPVLRTTSTQVTEPDTSAGVMISTVIANGPSLIPPLPPATVDTSSTLTVNLSPVIALGTASASTVTTVSSSTTSTSQTGSEVTGSSTTSSSTQTSSTSSAQKSSGSGSQSGNSGTASTAVSDSETATSSQTSTQTASKQGSDKPVATTESVTKSGQKAAASTPVSRAAAHAAARARDTQMTHTHHHVGAAPVVAKAELPGSGMVYSNSGELMPAFEPTIAKTPTSTTSSKSGAKQRDVIRAHDVDDLTDPNNPMSVMMLIL